MESLLCPLVRSLPGTTGKGMNILSKATLFLSPKCRVEDFVRKIGAAFKKIY
jgi:hypothetical protein